MHFFSLPGWAIGGYVPYTLKREMSGDLSFHPSFSNEDDKWMFTALLEGMKGSGISNPNPSVGCIIVKNGYQLSSGATEAYHLRHAERVAIESVPKTIDLTGATAYVTLEPCAHKGYQPPCMDLFIEKKISRVVVTSLDPNPKVSGKGIEKLKKHGIEVVVGVLKREAILWHLPFMAAQILKRPVLIGKWAQSQSGLLANDQGDSKWITGPKARAYGQWLRQKYDVILVGAGTLIKDHPKLTVRDCREPVTRQPLRIVVDFRSRIKEITSEMLSTTFNADSPTVVISSQNARPPQNLPKHSHFIQLKSDDAVYEIQEWVSSEHATQIFGKPIQSIQIEGGAALLNLFLMCNAFDILHVFTGQKTLTGKKHQVKFSLDVGEWTAVTKAKLESDMLDEYVKRSLLETLLK